MKTKTLIIAFTLLSLSLSAQFTVSQLDDVIRMQNEYKAQKEYIDTLESRLTDCEYSRKTTIEMEKSQREALNLASSTIGLLVEENTVLEQENAKKEQKLKRRNRWGAITGGVGVVIGGVVAWLVK